MGSESLKQHAVEVFHDLFNRERSLVEYLTQAVESVPGLAEDLARHKYMMGVFKTCADELSGPRGEILYSEAWRNAVCPTCVANRGR
jgi:hypothetical protein